MERHCFGVSICEDLWYPDGPAREQAGPGGAQLLINISSSPFYLGKGGDRERMLATRAADNRACLAYCNLTGGQDELVFDGQSLIFGPQGELLARASQFEEDFLVADLDLNEVFRWRLFDPRRRKQPGETRAPLAGDRHSALPPDFQNGPRSSLKNRRR